MSGPCYRIEELGEIAELDPRDPRRAHARDCPRCRSLLLAVSEFRDAQTVPAGAQPAAAERALTAALERELAGGAAPRAKAASPPWYARWAEVLCRPTLRPVIATGALAVLVLVIAVLFSGEESPHPVIVRDADSAASNAPAIHPPTYAADGSITLRWRPAADADAYEVLFFDLNLHEIHRQTAGRDTLLHLDLPALRVELPPGEQEVLWQIRALRGGDVIGESPPGTLVLP